MTTIMQTTVLCPHLAQFFKLSIISQVFLDEVMTKVSKKNEIVAKVRKSLPDLESARCKTLQLIWSHQKPVDTLDHQAPQIFYLFAPMQDGRTT